MRGGLGTVAKMTKRTTVQARGGSPEVTIDDKIRKSQDQLNYLKVIIDSKQVPETTRESCILNLNISYGILEKQSIVQPQKMLKEIDRENKKYTGIKYTYSSKAGKYSQYIQLLTQIKSIITTLLCPITFQKMEPYRILFKKDIQVSYIDMTINNLKDWVKCIKKTGAEIIEAVSTSWNKQEATEKEIAMVDCIKDPKKRQQWDAATSSDTLNRMVADIKMQKAKMQPYSVLFDNIDFDNISDWIKCTEKSDTDINDAITSTSLPDDIPMNLRVMVNCIKVPKTRQQWDAATTLEALNRIINENTSMTPQTKPSPTST